MMWPTVNNEAVCNMIERKQILQQTGIFLKQNPGEAHLITKGLQQMAENNSA